MPVVEEGVPTGHLQATSSAGLQNTWGASDMILLTSTVPVRQEAGERAQQAPGLGATPRHLFSHRPGLFVGRVQSIPTNYGLEAVA